jgi:RNA polymerase sigma-70 factor (ECF subfamily)
MTAANQDLALAEAARQGDADAFQTLHDLYRPRVHRFLLSRMRDGAEAEDLTQEVFTRVFLHLDRYEGRSTLSTWILGIARNESLHRMRTIRRRRAREVVEEQDGLADVVPLDQALDARRTLAATAQALEDLDEDRRDLVLAPVLDEVSVAELASRRGLKVGAIKSRQHRIRQGLRTAIAHAA